MIPLAVNGERCVDLSLWLRWQMIPGGPWAHKGWFAIKEVPLEHIPEIAKVLVRSTTAVPFEPHALEIIAKETSNAAQEVDPRQQELGL